MARLEIWVTKQLMQRLRAFAKKQHGDGHRMALAQVVEAALRWWLKKRLLHRLAIIWDVEEGGDEVYKILMKEDKDGES